MQVAIRVPSAWLEMADEVAKAISRPGFTASRTDGFLVAMARGFEAMRMNATDEGERASKANDPRVAERVKLEMKR